MDSKLIYSTELLPSQTKVNKYELN